MAQKILAERLQNHISAVDSSAERLELATRALLESEGKYRTIVENIEDGYYEVDLAGNFVFFNAAMANMTGYTPEELKGMNNRDILDTYNAKRVYDVFNKVYVTGLATRAFDWELIKKDGSKCTIEVSISPKNSLQGRIDGFMGIARDVTHRPARDDEVVALELLDVGVGLQGVGDLDVEVVLLELLRHNPRRLLRLVTVPTAPYHECVAHLFDPF